MPRGAFARLARISALAVAAITIGVVVAPIANADATVTVGPVVPITYDAAITGPVTHASIDAVSCTSPGDCVAVGTFTSPSSPDASFTMSSTNGVWSPATQIGGANQTIAVSAKSVSCSSGGSCFVVGSIKLSATSTVAFIAPVGGQPFEADFGTSPLATAPYSQFNSISCTRANNCVAVGDAVDAQNVRTPFMESVTSSTQSPSGQQTPIVVATYGALPPASPAVATLTTVSCSSPGNCTATGSYTNAAKNQTAISVTEANGSWGSIIPVAFAPHTLFATPLSIFSAVSCTGAHDCTAIGEFMDVHGDIQPFSATLSRGVWSNARPPVFGRGVQNSSPHAVYTALSCSSPGNCTAVGAYNIVSTPAKQTAAVRGFGDVQTNGTWANATSSVLRAGVEAAPYNDYFTGVSCAAASFCTAVGQYQDATGAIHPFLESSLAGTWQRAVVPVISPSIQYSPTDAAFAAVSCPQVGNCLAVGYYSNTADSAQGFSQFTTGPPPSATTARVLASHHVVGSSVTVRAHVTGHHPSGRVSFSVDGLRIVGCAARPLNAHGQSTCVSARFARGHHVITVVYLGDAKNGPSMSRTTVTVSPH